MSLLREFFRSFLSSGLSRIFVQRLTGAKLHADAFTLRVLVKISACFTAAQAAAFLYAAAAAYVYLGIAGCGRYVRFLNYDL